MDKITSLQNEKIKKIIKLRKARVRQQNELIIVEGKKELELALAAGWEVTEFYFSLTSGEKMDFKIDTDLITEVSPEVFAKISYRDHPDGYLALVRPQKLDINKVKLSSEPLVIVLEKVEKPGNLGAILRTVDATGADLVILNDQQTDIYNPNVVRASRGTIFTVPVVVLSKEETKIFLKKHKIKSFAATDQAKIDYTAVDFTGPTAIILGAEDEGLSKEWLDSADELIKIPMQGQIDSLNVSVAAAVIVYEAVRQRKEKK